MVYVSHNGGHKSCGNYATGWGDSRAGLEASLSSAKASQFVSLGLFLNLYLQVSSHKWSFTDVYITQFAPFMLFGYYLGHREALHELSVLLQNTILGQ